MIFSRRIIFKVLLALMPVALSVAFAGADGRDMVYVGQVTRLYVAPVEGASYLWEIFCDPRVDLANTPGNCNGNEAEFVQGMNDQPGVAVVFNVPGLYFYKVTVFGEDGCRNSKIGMLQVIDSLPMAEVQVYPSEICAGEPSVITITFTGEPPWSFIIFAFDADEKVTDVFEFADISPEGNPFEFAVIADRTSWYRIVHVADAHGEYPVSSDAVKLTVHPRPNMSPVYVKENP